MVARKNVIVMQYQLVKSNSAPLAL
uniref:Uncharacterized protein n=1 Tax=Rhizophora mucronata TaxID=61149 RepID=A0A2P2P8T0_RHIMU